MHFLLAITNNCHHKFLHVSCEGKEFSPVTGTVTDGNGERSCELKILNHNDPDNFKTLSWILKWYKKKISSGICWFLFVSDLFFWTSLSSTSQSASGIWTLDNWKSKYLQLACLLEESCLLDFFCYRTKSNWCANLNHRDTGSGRTWIVL